MPAATSWIHRIPAAGAILVFGLVLGSGCVSCGAQPGSDSGMGADSGGGGGDDGGVQCTAIDQCGEGMTCEFGQCVPCPPDGCPEFTSIPLPETGIVWWTFASGGTLAESSTSAEYEVVGIVGHNAAIAVGDDAFAQTSATHTHYGGFASILTAVP